MSDDQVEGLTYYPNVRRSGRDTHPPDRYFEFPLPLHSIVGAGELHESLKYEEAVTGLDKESWRQGMNEKLDGTYEKGVLTLSKLPIGFKEISTR